MVTLVGLTLAAAVALMPAVSGPIAAAIGGAIGLGDVAQTIWSIARKSAENLLHFRIGLGGPL